MRFEFDGEVTTRHRRCDVCGEVHDLDSGFVTRDGDRYAVFFAAWYPHEGEAWVDVTLGSWQAPEYPDQVTFGCRIGHVPGQAEPACSLTQGGAALGDEPIFGRRLDRDAALTDPRLSAFWELVDWLIVNDPLLHRHVFHMPPTPDSA